MSNLCVGGNLKVKLRIVAISNGYYISFSWLKAAEKTTDEKNELKYISEKPNNWVRTAILSNFNVLYSARMRTNQRIAPRLVEPNNRYS
mgnify:CR=1 FL=1|jgi:hypothetical protein